MIIALTIFAIISVYAFIGGMIGARHHAIKKRTCGHKNCFTLGYSNNRWAEHVVTSVWAFGVLWPFALPVALGTLVGSQDNGTRTERRRARELAEAKHKAEIATQERIANEELDRQLEKVARGLK